MCVYFLTSMRTVFSLPPLFSQAIVGCCNKYLTLGGISRREITAVHVQGMVLTSVISGFIPADRVMVAARKQEAQASFTLSWGLTGSP